MITYLETYFIVLHGYAHRLNTFSRHLLSRYIHLFYKFTLIKFLERNMMNVEKRVFKRKLKKLQDAAKPKMSKIGENGIAIEKEPVSLFSVFFKQLFHCVL